ncbi:MAG: ABC transporter substrate-binding protein [Candidatus Rokuibacteriota bacterium]|nr:MAG: ABC transporter substrate-binding protein [Candidatus Rokubacteria bacterium]
MITTRLIALALTLAVIAGLGGDLAAQPRAPIKVGVFLSLTGPLAPLGAFNKSGIEVAVQEVGGQIGGRKIELVYEDDEGKPDVGLSKIRKLVEQDRVAVVVGPVSSPVALAAREYMVSKGVPWVLTFATAPSLTRELGAPNIFRASWSGEQAQYPSGAYVYQKLGYQRIAVLGLDYVAGRAEAKAFSDGFKAAGGKSVQEIWVPLGAPDAAPFVTQIQPGSVDAVVGAAIWGSDAIRVIRAFEEYGVKGRMPIVVINTAVADGSLLPSLGKTALGLRSYGPYCFGLDTPENKKFVEAFTKHAGKAPGIEAYIGYTAGRIAMEGAKAVAGNVEDRPAYLAALRAVDYVGPTGRFRFDQNRNALVNIFLQEVRQAGADIFNAPVDVIGREVAQR